MAGRRARNNATGPPLVDEDLLTRTSWVNAEIAYNQLKKGKVDGNKYALWERRHLHYSLFSLGCFIQLHAEKVLFIGVLLLSLCCVGLKTVDIETNVEKLWVEDGGRLQKELEYTNKMIGEGSGSTYEILIQTPKVGEVLSQRSLVAHLEAMVKATSIEINYVDKKTKSSSTWTFRDICYAASFPPLESLFDELIEKLVPCIIITPLDCFWDGAKIHGPSHALKVPFVGGDLKWTNLNPEGILKILRDVGYSYPNLEELFRRAGISTGYLEKPCLNPADPECPMTAANKLSGKVPNIGAELTGGCNGFAKKFMHWEEELIVGGVQKNKTGHIIRAEALQSVLQLSGEKELYENYQGHYKVHSMEWSKDVALEILNTWQRAYTREMNQINSGNTTSEFSAFSMTSLIDIMDSFSSVSPVRITFGYILMVIYACVSLLRWNNSINSQCTVGMLGVMLVALSVTAGLGMCSLLGVKFNASTTQIIPFLALGLGVDDMFLIVHTYAENFNNDHMPILDRTGHCLRKVGVSVLITSLANMLAFFSAAIIPIPALRAFSLQAGILVLFNMGTILLIYPAIVSLDLRRKQAKRMDFLCCWKGVDNKVEQLQANVAPTDLHTTSFIHETYPPPCYSPPPAYSVSSTVHPTEGCQRQDTVIQTTPASSPVLTSLCQPDPTLFTRSTSLPSVCNSTSSSRVCLSTHKQSCSSQCVRLKNECLQWNLTCLVTSYYAPLLQKTPIKVLVFVVFIILISVGIWGTVKVKDGLELTDVIPRDTTTYRFLERQQKYFSFYQIFAVTKGDFDYTLQQQMLLDYHKSFKKVEKIMKREGGSLPMFWLDVFRQWLLGLQKTFDEEVLGGKFHDTGWHQNASHDAILAYKLLSQTGNVDNPVKRSQIRTLRLVDEDGVIYSPAFYNYLTAWTSVDVLAYESTMADFHPTPKPWTHDMSHVELIIPKAAPLEFTQISFYIYDLAQMDAMINAVMEVRSICDDFTARGLPNYPRGVPFTFWEQYLSLRFYLLLSLILIISVTFLVLLLVLMNFWIALIIVGVITSITVELFGVMGLTHIKLSAIPAVILIISVGIGVEFTVHICMGFMTAIGSRNHRMSVSLTHTTSPVIHGAVSTFLGIIMLVGSEFDFIINYFFNVLASLMLLGVINGLLFLPVFLSVFGPQAEVRPKNAANRISPPTPEPVRTRHRKRGGVPDVALSTISEEPTQISSQIVVAPEVVVETTCSGDGGCGGANRQFCQMNNDSPTSSHVTRVKATATVKVEVQTQLPGYIPAESCGGHGRHTSGHSCSQQTCHAGCDEEHSYKSKRRKPHLHISCANEDASHA